MCEWAGKVHLMLLAQIRLDEPEATLRARQVLPNRSDGTRIPAGEVILRARGVRYQRGAVFSPGALIRDTMHTGFPRDAR